MTEAIPAGPATAPSVSARPRSKRAAGAASALGLDLLIALVAVPWFVVTRNLPAEQHDDAWID